MSGYRGHLATGLIFYGSLATVAATVHLALGYHATLLYRSWWDLPVQIVVAVLFSLWPDVDIASQGRKIFYRIALVLDIYLLATERWHAAAFLGLAAIVPALGKHRGWTHTFIAAILVPLPILLAPIFVTEGYAISRNPQYDHLAIGLPYYLAALIGYLSHLFADGLLWRSMRSLSRASAPKRSGVQSRPDRITQKATDKTVQGHD